MLLNPYRFMSIISQDSPAKSILNSLISWWDFTETTGSVFYDSHGISPLNISGGTAATLGGTGKNGRGFHIPTAGGFAYASGNANDPFKIQNGQSFTLFAWINIAVDASYGQHMHLMGRADIPDQQSYFLALYGGDTDSLALYTSATGATGISQVAQLNPAGSGWQLVAAGINAETGKTFLIKNGVRTEETFAGPLYGGATSLFSIGRAVSSAGTQSPGYPFPAYGTFDGAGMLNKAITDEEYAVLYNSGNGITYSNLQATLFNGSFDYPKLINQIGGVSSPGTTSHSIPLGDYNAGDLILVFVSGRSTDSTIPLSPAGWFGTINYFNTTVNPGGRGGVLHKVMTSGDGKYVQVTFPDVRTITYTRLRFKAGSFDPDLGYLMQVSAPLFSGVTSAAPSIRPGRYYKSATVVRALLNFSDTEVVEYPYPSGEKVISKFSGSATALNKTYANTEVNVTVPNQIINWPSWKTNKLTEARDVLMLIRGSKPLGHIDPTLLTSFAFTSPNNAVYIGATSNLKVGDLVIAYACSSAGSLSYVRMSANFTSLYSVVNRQIQYRVVTPEDIGTNLDFSFTTAGLHAVHAVRIRAGTYNPAVAPYVSGASSGTSSTSVLVPAGIVYSSYAGRRNLKCVFIDTASATGIPAKANSMDIDLGPFLAGGTLTNSVAASFGFGCFDGTSVPVTNCELSSSSSWDAVTVVVQGIAIPT